MSPRSSPVVVPKASRRDIPCRAFTRSDFAVVVGSCFIVCVLVLPMLGNTSARSDQLLCLNNLRQIGIAFQAWGTDHEDRRPWFVSTSEGGTQGHPLRHNAYLHFASLSNHLSPRLLVDAGDLRKRIANNWSQGEGGFLNPGFANNAVSYMIGTHTTRPEVDILLSDRNVQFEESTSCAYGFLPVFAYYNDPRQQHWTNGLHAVGGNLLMNDGRVEFAREERLAEILASMQDSGSFHWLTPF